MLREIHFKVFRKLLRKSKIKSITIDIDSSVVNVEGHQEGTAKGYNPKKPGNPCYNIQFAFCDEFKAYPTGYVRSGDTYTANGAARMIQEIIAHLKEDGLEIIFRMDSGYFDEDILETIETLGCTYVIKGKAYPTLVEQATDPSIVFVASEEGQETTELVTTLNTWNETRRFVISRVLKDEKGRKQLSFLESEAYDYFFFVNNHTSLSSEEVIEFYEKRGNCENYIKEAKYDMAVGHLRRRKDSLEIKRAFLLIDGRSNPLYTSDRFYKAKHAQAARRTRRLLCCWITTSTTRSGLPGRLCFFFLTFLPSMGGSWGK